MNFNWKELPILGAILKILSNESVVLAVVTTTSATYLSTHHYDNLIVYLILAAGYFVGGTWHLADIRKGLVKHRAEVETLLKEALHAKIDFPLPDGRILKLDIPDEIEAPLLKEIIKGILGE